MAKNQTFGQWLTQRMGILGLKTYDIAKACEVTTPAVSLWRTGVNVPDSARIKALAEILQVTPDTILYRLDRLKPREDLTKEWEDMISRVREAGDEAERVVFALIDAYLLAIGDK